jgi:isocitrate/isopropylmalate dehydrogenase
MPDIALELVRIDTFSSAFSRDPHRYRLVATSNLFGDILSDQASGLAGGVGIAPSLNAGGEHAMAQAVHGTAPDGHRRKGDRQPPGLDPVDGAVAELEACREIARLLDRGVRMRSPAAPSPRISAATPRPTRSRPP